MTRDEAKEHIRKNPGEYLQPDGKKKGYICPVCGSGSGEHGTGMTTKDGIHFTCWSCGDIENNDIIDIIAIENKITDTKDKFDMAYKIYGFNFNAESSQKSTSEPKSIKNGGDGTQTPSANKNTLKDENGAQKKDDYTNYLISAAKALENNKEAQDYLISRGLSMATVQKFKLGYDPAWIHPNPTNPNKPGYPSQRIIIPATIYGYTARAIDPGVDVKFKALKAGVSSPYNLKALSQEQPIFIVEGEFDALSIAEVGGQAVALGTTTNVKHLVAALKKKTPITQGLILALDNDDPGRKATKDLSGALKEIGAKHIIFNVSGESKDANEALCKDKPLFLKAVHEAIKKVQELPEEETEKESYLKNSAAYHLQEFINGITDSVNTPFIPTGFEKLDGILDGGLYEGLYIVGAISSLGKTTLVTQIADQIAEAGTDILIFSLEMARSELMAKSISRLTLLNTIKNGGESRNAKTARGITTGTRYPKYSKEERTLITSSIEEYGRYADRIYISEGRGDIGASKIRAEVEKHIRYTGNKPVVIIDYVQILTPYSERGTDKQNTDKAVMELKRISRDFKIPVIGISSFNRMSYSTSVSMEAFKESGAIEYSSDVLIGLQLKGAGGKEFNVNEQKNKNPRDVELVMLKNRNGANGKTVCYEYYPLFNYFRES